MWFFFFSSRRRHTRSLCDWSSDVCSSDLVPGLPPGLTVEDMCDWDKMCAIIADSEPWWEPGAKIGYHAVTWGYIVGEIIRRASGKSISQALHEEVAKPLGVADELFFAVP